MILIDLHLSSYNFLFIIITILSEATLRHYLVIIKKQLGIIYLTF